MPATSSASRTTRPSPSCEDIEIIKRELPLDILEFFCLTPLPGSEDHKVLWQKGVWMDPDMNKYDLEHVTTGHARMTPEEWHEVYRAGLVDLLHARAHADDPAPRRRGRNMGMSRLMAVLFVFSAAVPVEKRASAAGRLLPPEVPARPAARLSDRAGVAFYPKYVWEIAVEARPHC